MNSDAGKYFIEHAGVKGMKWGVIRDDDEIARSRVGGSKPAAKKAAKVSGSDDAMAKAAKDFYKNKDPKQLQAEGKAKQKAKANQEFPPKNSKTGPKKDIEDDSDPASAKPSRLSDKQKRALKIGAGVAVAGLLIYGSQKMGSKPAQKSGLSQMEIDDAFFQAKLGNSKPKISNDPRAKARAAAHADEMDSLFGAGSREPKAATGFYTGLQNGKFIDRPEFTIPKSTVFQRLSGHPEDGTGYNKGTYATFLTNDNKRYGSSQEFGHKAHTINFTPKDEVRVPSARTVLETLKATGGYDGKPLSDAETMSKYHAISGGGWKDETSQKLISGLKKQGYSALVDDMDAGYYGDMPVVFFGEPDKVTAKPRTSADYKADKESRSPVLGRYA